MTTPIQLRTVDGTTVGFSPEHLIVAGYTGRDEAAVRKHIDELAAFGIAPPPSVPMFYELDPALLTTEPDLTSHARVCSGEVEPVLIRAGGHWYLAVGSDHTDRELERADIAQAKSACPKPISAHVLPLPGPLADLSLDDAVATSHVDGVLYQQGSLAGLRPLAELFDLAPKELTAGAGDLAMFGGTLALLDGEFVAGDDWSLDLTLPSGQRLTHRYRIERTGH